jgi:hypothetical protein
MLKSKSTLTSDFDRNLDLGLHASIHSLRTPQQPPDHTSSFPVSASPLLVLGQEMVSGDRQTWA